MLLICATADGTVIRNSSLIRREPHRRSRCKSGRESKPAPENPPLSPETPTES